MGSTTNNRRHKQYQPSASVVDGTLILTLPDARTPTVWRMGLETVSAASFQVVQAAQGDGYTLVMTSPDDQEYSIAGFDSRDEAVDALLAAAEAMKHAGYEEQAASPVSRDRIPDISEVGVQQDTQLSRSGRGRGLLTMAGVVLIVILLYMIANTGPQRFATQERAAGSSAGSSTKVGGAQQRSMSAEQFFQQQQ